MIISHKYKFIFIKTYKTAGTSIEVFLSNCCSAKDIFTPIKPVVETHLPRNYLGYWNPFKEIFYNSGKYTKWTLKKLIAQNKYYNHIPASILKNRVSRSVWDSYYKFCVERNPWDKTISHYYMLYHRSNGKLTFDQYLKNGNYCINYPLYTNKNGKIIVDKVIHYEKLNSELNNLFNSFGIEYNNSLGVNAKSKYRIDKRDYRDILNNDQKKIIDKLFGYELYLFNYEY